MRATTARRARTTTVLRVLVVDDEEDMRVLVSTLVTVGREEVRVVGHASSGEEAIELWREHHPDLVVLDQRMPGISGLEVAARILADQPDQVIVLFSAFLTPEMRNEASRLGVARCIGKDEIHRLRTVVEDLGLSA